MPSNNSQPRGWGSDEVSRFLSAAHDHALATFANVPNFFLRANEIDAIFRHAIKYYGSSADWLGGVFLMRAHAAFLGTLRVAVGGQNPEAFMLMRSVLEAGLYAFHIQSDPTRARIWFERDEDNDSRRACRWEFTARRAFQSLHEVNPSLRQVVSELYERAIDQGGHPNVQAFLGNLGVEHDADDIKLNLSYLTGPTNVMQLCLKSTLQCGVACLKIFESAFPEKFKILGISGRIQKSERGL